MSILSYSEVDSAILDYHLQYLQSLESRSGCNSRLVLGYRTETNSLPWPYDCGFLYTGSSCNGCTASKVRVRSVELSMVTDIDSLTPLCWYIIECNTISTNTINEANDTFKFVCCYDRHESWPFVKGNCLEINVLNKGEVNIIKSYKAISPIKPYSDDIETQQINLNDNEDYKRIVSAIDLKKYGYVESVIIGKNILLICACEEMAHFSYCVNYNYVEIFAFDLRNKNEMSSYIDKDGRIYIDGILQ